MLGKPVISLVLLVIGGVVLDEIHPVTAAVKGRQQYLIHKNQVGLPLEVILLVLVNKFGVVQAHRTKNLLGVALSSCRHLGLAPPPRPSGMQRGRLPERSFVFENNYRPFLLGVFF